MDCADLEIGLHRQDTSRYRVELRFIAPKSDADNRWVEGGLQLALSDLDQLGGPTLDAVAYGEKLSGNLFADSKLREAFMQGRTIAQDQEVPLRLRLFIGPSAPELHNLCWETLRDPEDGSSLLADEQILFSRYLSSLDWQPVPLRSRADLLRALVVIANPRNLSTWQSGGRSLPSLDVAGELERARSSLRGIHITPLASAGTAALNNVITHLRDGYDILYLVCHGDLSRGEPSLWLEDEAGNVKIEPGSELVARLKDLRQQLRPRLVVLASCQSAGSGDDQGSSDKGVLAALGPRLAAEAGIPAVLAMQGDITLTTVKQFMPAFFQQLKQDGQVDRAMTVAQGKVRERFDWWVPVLFMRLKSGRIWYATGLALDRRGLEKWPALLNNIRQGKCTPILGPGLTESLLSSRCEIARRLAEDHWFPMAPHDCEDLPRVAQYLAVYQDLSFLRGMLAKGLCQEVLERWGGDLPDASRGASLEKLEELDKLLAAAGAQRREQDPMEPHRVLAGMPLPIYVTTDFSTLLTDALVAMGKAPQVRIYPWWTDDVEPLPAIYKYEPGYQPNVQQPLVYHLFGRLQEPDSLVLTEDDYFDFLIHVTRNKKLVPSVVLRALADTALLFLGFRMDDWDFRVLFRSIMSQEGGKRRKKYANVAVQIDPEESRTLEPERARRYLESYFEDADISIYWGSVDDFAQELQRRWEADAP